MEEKKKRVFLLLPELDEEVKILTSQDAYSQKCDGYVLLNVYEHYRRYMDRIEATKLSLNMLGGFDELWYYGAFGLTTPMYCLIEEAKRLNLPMKDLQPIRPKESFSLVYKFAMEYHPSKGQTDEYWKELVEALGTYSKDNNPLNSCLLIAIFNYYEDIYKNHSPKVSQDDHFNLEFKKALSFSLWAFENDVVFEDGIDPLKVSKSPTPMLKALLSGFQKYYQTYQKNLKENKLKNKGAILL